MTYRHTKNFTGDSQRRQVHSETYERQKDGVAKQENSPLNVNVDTGADLRFKAHEWQPIGAAQESTAPILISTVPDINLTQNVLMTPYDFSQHFIGDVTLYGLTVTPSGLSFDTATGILSGTPDTLSSTNPIVDADGTNSNVFNISVSAA